MVKRKRPGSVGPLSKAVQRNRAKVQERMAALGIQLRGMTYPDNPSAGGPKFHNVKAFYKGESYDSAGEAEYAARLDLRCASGEIVDWERPKPIVLLDAPKARDRVTYRPDFYVIPNVGFGYYVDYKGSRITETAAWRIKVKLWKQNERLPELRVAYPTGEEKVVCSRPLLTLKTPGAS